MLNIPRARAVAKGHVRRWLRARKGYHIVELPSADMSLVANVGLPRINLVMLGIGKGRAFGGVDTALRFFEAIRPYFPRARIIVVGEGAGEFDARDWPGWFLELVRPDADCTLVFLGGGRSHLQVEVADRFIATYWRTAYFVQELCQQIEAVLKFVSPYIYLIQDFEPGFYPWSELYLLSDATYKSPYKTIAVYNTKLLHDYFENLKYDFDFEYVFEPRLHPKLAAHQRKAAAHPKRRLMLVYGRPGAPRNAFDLAVEGLRMWARLYPGARDWEVLLLGEAHRDIPLRRGLSINSKGKISLDDYANYLLDASVGLSLMASPHPSYPPLEMAEFGVRVVTNDFANKSLANCSTNITSVASARPRAIADALIRSCEACDLGSVEIDQRQVFLGGEVEFPFAEALAAKTPRT